MEMLKRNANYAVIFMYIEPCLYGPLAQNSKTNLLISTNIKSLTPYYALPLDHLNIVILLTSRFLGCVYSKVK